MLSSAQFQESIAHQIIAHPVIQQLLPIAIQLNTRLYAVGGVLRDVALGLPLPEDVDLVVISEDTEDCPQGKAYHLAKQIADLLDGRYVLLDETFGIHRVVLKAYETVLDISDALENDLQKDCYRRDLTINAMMLDLQNQEFYDPTGGLQDLAVRRVRMISAENLLDDPLRLLRVFRFAAQLQAEIDAETLAVVQANGERLWQSAGERVQVEFLKLLSAKYCFPTLQQMGESGFLEVILPELKETRAVPPNTHHHLWLFDHTLELVNQAEQFITQFPEESQAWIQSDYTPFCTRMALVKLACLLHDVGKPETMAIPEDGPPGKVTFYGHEKRSEEMTDDVGDRLKLSHDMTEHVKKLVRWHLYPCQFGQGSARKSVLRFFRRIDSLTPDLILLAIADRLSTRGPEISDAVVEKSLADHLWLAAQYEIESKTVLKLPRLLNGHEIMSLLKLKPGPEVKELLELLQEAQQLGEIQTPEDAKQYLLSLPMREPSI